MRRRNRRLSVDSVNDSGYLPIGHFEFTGDPNVACGFLRNRFPQLTKPLADCLVIRLGLFAASVPAFLRREAFLFEQRRRLGDVF